MSCDIDKGTKIFRLVNAIVNITELKMFVRKAIVCKRPWQTDIESEVSQSKTSQT